MAKSIINPKKINKKERPLSPTRQSNYLQYYFEDFYSYKSIHLVSRDPINIQFRLSIINKSHRDVLSD